MLVFDTGAAANLVRFRSLERRDRLMEKEGLQRVPTYPSTAQFRSGGGRLGTVRHAADILVGVAGKESKFTAFALDADIPSLLREGVMEALSGQPGLSRYALALRKQGAAIPARANRMGRYILSVVDFG